MFTYLLTGLFICLFIHLSLCLVTLYFHVLLFVYISHYGMYLLIRMYVVYVCMCVCTFHCILIFLYIYLLHLCISYIYLPLSTSPFSFITTPHTHISVYLFLYLLIHLLIYPYEHSPTHSPQHTHTQHNTYSQLQPSFIGVDITLRSSWAAVSSARDVFGAELKTKCGGNGLRRYCHGIING